MQAAIDELTAEQVHEDPGATKKDDGAQDHRVVKNRVDTEELIRSAAQRIDYLD